MIPKGRPSKGGVGLGTITDEAASRMGVESEEEGDEEVMCVPECLI